MQSHDGAYGITIRPRGRTAADEYYHEGNTWIEGREGSTYTIDITNRTGSRALFVVSVDGLDVLEGKPAGLHSRGYVLSALETLSIPGWKVNDSTAAEFYFSRSSKSYVSSMGGNVSNTGVIGVMVFAESVTVALNPSWADVNISPYSIPRYNVSTTPLSPNWVSSNSATLTASSVRGLAKQIGIMSNSAQASYGASQQEVGTGFGDATSWQTNTVQFMKQDANKPNAMLAIYYNTAKNLEKMGIQLRRKHNPSYKANPFPAYNGGGCVPPPGWQG